MLMKSAEYNGISSLSWKLALALLGAWLLVFITKAKGVTVSGKIIYFTAVFPYVMLIILLIRGCLLPGSGRGIQFYVKPNIEKLKDFTVHFLMLFLDTLLLFTHEHFPGMERRSRPSIFLIGTINGRFGNYG